MTDTGPSRSIPLGEALAAFDRVGDTNEPLTASEVAAELDCARRTAYGKLEALTERGDLRTKKVGARGRVWWRPRDGASGADVDELRRLNEVNAVVRSAGRATVEAETREGLAERVCECVTSREPYLFAVAGEFTPSFEQFTPWATAGGEEYLEAVLDPDRSRPLAEGVGARAARTGEVRAVQHVDELPHEFWRDAGAAHGVASYASVPLVYEDVVYGVLGVFANQPDAFGESEREILRELGATVGHAVNALDRKEALVADEMLEVEYRSERLARPLAEAGLQDDAVSADRVVPLPGGGALQYYTLRDAGEEVDGERYVEALESVPTILDARQIRDGPDHRFEAHLSSDALATTVASYGGRASEALLEGGELRFVAEFPRAVDLRGVTEAVKETYPDLRLVRKVSKRRRRLTGDEFRTAIDDQLTERQRIAVEMAYHAGYFEWPRDTTGGELAARMGVSNPTFHNHLRKGERELLRVVFEERADAPVDGDPLETSRLGTETSLTD